MTEFLPMLNVLISGLFGLLVAFVTIKLNQNREKRKFAQELVVSELRDREQFYCQLLSVFDKRVRAELSLDGDRNQQLIDDIALNLAKAQLVAPKPITDQVAVVNETLNAWSIEYKKGAPKRITGSSFGLISNMDFEHRNRADELFEDVRKESQKLVTLVKTELNRIRGEIYS